MSKIQTMSATIILFICSSVLALSAQNNDEQTWWFNVELIVFKRNIQPGNTENFEQEQFVLNTVGANDLLYLSAMQKTYGANKHVRSLPICGAQTNIEDKYGASIQFDIQSADERATSLEFMIPDDYAPVVSNRKLINDMVKPFEHFSQESAKGIHYKANTNDSSERPSSLLSVVENKLKTINANIEALSNTVVSLTCVNELRTQPHLSAFMLPQIGPTLFASDSQFNGHKQLLSEPDLTLQGYAQKVFRQRDIESLLYTAWRQKVEFGSENTKYMRVRAGNVVKSTKKPDYEEWYKAYSLKQSTSTTQTDDVFFENLERDLNTNENVDWQSLDLQQNHSLDSPFIEQQQYEVDGKLKVYLDYVNQVPYLHIDNEFNHFKLVLDENGDSLLKAFPLKQKRRVISKQIHYFDHPAFGIIVRLERFTPPLQSDSPANTDSQ